MDKKLKGVESKLSDKKTKCKGLKTDLKFVSEKLEGEISELEKQL